MEASSVFAVSQVAQTKSVYRKIWWIAVFAVGLCGSGYQVTQFLQLYFQYPILTNIQVENAKDLDFPAVTICNLNRMRNYFQSCLEDNVSFGECVESLSAQSGPLVMSERKSVSSCSNHLTGLKNANRNLKIKFLMNYAKIGTTDRRLAGVEYQNFVKFCSFGGRLCDSKDFSYLQSIQFGNCYTFNKEKSSQSQQFSPGAETGLELILSMESGLYQSATSTVGARITIHDPSEDPNPEDEGITVGPGFETLLSVSQKVTRRLPSPYRDRCINYRYSESVRGKNRHQCVASCIQEQSLSRCSCVDPSLHHAGNVRQCNITDKEDSCCLDSVLDIMAIQGIPCDCPLPCSSTAYRVQISRAKWPSKHDNDFAFTGGVSDETMLKSYRGELAKVILQYSTLEQVVLHQAPMFINSELFSNLGGQFSLWLGLSLFALFELIELIILLCMRLKRRLCNRRHRVHPFNR